MPDVSDPTKSDAQKAIDDAAKNTSVGSTAPPSPGPTPFPSTPPPPVNDQPISPPTDTPAPTPLAAPPAPPEPATPEPTPAPSSPSTVPDDSLSADLAAKEKMVDDILSASEPKPTQLPASPPTETPKKKNRLGPILAVLLLLVGTIPLVVAFTRQQKQVAEIRTQAAGDECGNSCVRAGGTVKECKCQTGSSCVNGFCKANTPPSGGGGGSGGGSSGGGGSTSTAGTQPQGTYPVYQGGASSGTVVGYRYIQAPGVFEGAIQRAAGGSTADALLLAKQYGLSGANLSDAATHIAAGETWAPPGVGCNDIPNNPACTQWHWTTCTHSGTGMSGVGCDVASKPKCEGADCGGGETPQCNQIKVYKGGQAVSDLSSLHVGDQIVIGVAGGNATKAHVRMNGGAFTDMSTTKNANGEYTLDFTIAQASIVNNKIDIEAEILGTDGNWH